jgi:hypothetical protein
VEQATGIIFMTIGEVEVKDLMSQFDTKIRGNLGENLICLSLSPVFLW